MRRWGVLFVAAACACACGCGTKPHEPPTVAAPAPAAPISWTIECAPDRVAMSARPSVMVTIRATNTTAAAIAPERDPLDVLVDGKSSMELSMAFGNGGRGPEWSSLAPGATAVDQRNGMSIADAPGDHTISIVHDGAELARTTLHVTP